MITLRIDAKVDRGITLRLSEANESGWRQEQIDADEALELAARLVMLAAMQQRGAGGTLAERLTMYRETLEELVAALAEVA